MITKEMILEQQLVADEEAQKLKAIKRNYAIQECPYSIGQEVECLGYANTGKKMLIEEIEMPRGNFGTHKSTWCGDWLVRGHLIKKDGKLSVNVASFDHRQYKAHIEKQG